MKTIHVECDECGADITCSLSGYIFLTQEWPTRIDITEPIVTHFCNMACLQKHYETRKVLHDTRGT